MAKCTDFSWLAWLLKWYGLTVFVCIPALVVPVSSRGHNPILELETVHSKADGATFFTANFRRTPIILFPIFFSLSSRARFAKFFFFVFTGSPASYVVELQQVRGEGKILAIVSPEDGVFPRWNGTFWVLENFGIYGIDVLLLSLCDIFVKFCFSFFSGRMPVGRRCWWNIEGVRGINRWGDTEISGIDDSDASEIWATGKDGPDISRISPYTSAGHPACSFFGLKSNRFIPNFGILSYNRCKSAIKSPKNERLRIFISIFAIWNIQK